eukprot:GILK01004239.1.p1 GENE.GILK01004239.1~~GILK01004239.1.p1  ORF type:complete len:595 (+),score=160.00 GILK01004239.1:38-1786(+)
MASQTDTLPLDVQYHKLIEWLQVRQKLPQDWQKKLKAARLKLTAAVTNAAKISKSAVQTSVTSFLSEQPEENMNYFRAQKVVEMLIQSAEGQEKTLFGNYSSPFIQEWQKVVQGLAKDNLYLAEAAQIMVQNVNYEIPALKKAVSSNDKQIQELNRRQQDLKRTASESTKKFEEMCKKFQIKGDNFRAELTQLANNLPVLYDEIVSQLQQGGAMRAVEFYRSFVDMLGAKKSESATLLPYLAYICEFGNESIALKQWRDANPNQPPLDSLLNKPKNSNAASDAKESAEAGGAIDWGVGSTSDSTGIDWSISVDDQGTNATAAAIDWGGSGDVSTVAVEEGAAIDWSATNDTVETSTDGTAATISWDISANDNPGIVWDMPAGETASGGISWDVGDTTTVDNVSVEPAVSAESAQTLFQHTDSRNEILNDLLELETFLQQRLVEMSASDELSFSSQFQAAATIVKEQSIDSVQSYLKVIKQAIKTLMSPQTNQLLMISQSPKFLDRLVSMLQQQSDFASKQLQTATALEKKKDECLRVISVSQSQLEKLVDSVIELKRQVESSMAKLFDRKVHIVGEINKISK